MRHDPQRKYSPLPKQAAPAKVVGIVAIVLSLLAALIHPLASIVPLLLFVILCFTAPLLPGFSFFLPIVSRGSPAKQAVAVTFDIKVSVPPFM